VGTSARPETIHDFGGFPDELYALSYPCPGEPQLGDEILGLLSAAGVRAVPDARRGLDHGAWVPLRHAYPGAEIPALEVTLPSPRSPSDLIRMGQALAPLRGRGILLVGSGGIVHNLRRVRFADKAAPVEPWARAFDGWVRDRLEEGKVAPVAEYRSRAPEAASAVPTTEHFDPLFVVLGALGDGFRVRDVFEGFTYGNLSMRTFAGTSPSSQK
jgi:4,5-DOPA dioxygenase extradiol